MKSIIIYFCLLFSAFAYGQQNPYQTKIEAALGQSFATQSNQLDPIINELKEKGTDNAYWIAYAQFYSSVYLLKSGQKEKAGTAINSAIETLQNIEDKTSEDHALLGYVLGFSIALDPSSAARTSAKSEAQFRAALKKNENNLRAYLGMGENDFHTPEEYGGGKKVEEYLLKAISLPDQTSESGPSWGKNSAYYTLASYYMREGETDKAKMYCMQGLNKYPQDYQLNQLKNSF